ncbi:MAG: hypothetical protein LC808_12645, partial [Actinobacteria bacterium]|nr:hypothetical protein [Actinomycetota bacterium]
VGMQLQTGRDLRDCVRIFYESINKRPLKLKPFPFKCEAPQFSGDRASISASFQIAEPYGVVRMECERRGSVTLVDFFTDGNIRGRLTANSMAKSIALKLV